jgi:predicted nucleic acid-binding protein
MKPWVLIDTSAWIEASRRNGDTALRDEIAMLLQEERAAMTWPVWVELFQGAKGRREEESLRGWRETSRWLEFDEACWTEAASTARACLLAGVNVPFGDLLISACATRHGVELLERDRHFALIRSAKTG